MSGSGLGFSRRVRTASGWGESSCLFLGSAAAAFLRSLPPPSPCQFWDGFAVLVVAFEIDERAVAEANVLDWRAGRA